MKSHRKMVKLEIIFWICPILFHTRIIDFAKSTWSKYESGNFCHRQIALHARKNATHIHQRQTQVTLIPSDRLKSVKEVTLLNHHKLCSVFFAVISNAVSYTCEISLGRKNSERKMTKTTMPSHRIDEQKLLNMDCIKCVSLKEDFDYI